MSTPPSYQSVAEIRTVIGLCCGHTARTAVPAGRMVFLAGQTGTGPDGTIAGGIVPQFEQALRNLFTALDAAGGRPGDLVSLTVYLVDVEDYQAHRHDIGTVWRRLAGTGYPAMAAVGVTRLWDPTALVEIQGIAAVSPAEEVPPSVRG